MATPGGLGPGQRPPHITVNSGSGGDLLDTMRSPEMSLPSTPGLQTRNLLTGPIRPPYGSSHASSEMLLAPSTRRAPRPYQDSPTPSPTTSRPGSVMSSRRSSWASEAGGYDSRRSSLHNPFASPFDDSRSPSRAGSEDEVNTQTVAEKYNIMPSAGLLLFPEDVEKDDYLHNPEIADPVDKCEIFSHRGITNMGGLILIVVGLLSLFIIYPLL